MSESGGVVVVGSANVDRVLRATHHPAPGETVIGELEATGPGGKGLNQAVAARRQGATVALVAAVGADGEALALREFLLAEGVDVDGVEVVDEAPTGTAWITLDDTGQNTIVVASGANRALTAPALTPGPGDVVLAQLEVPQPAVAAALRIGRSAGATTILNAAPASPAASELLGYTDVLVVNEVELAMFGAVDAELDVVDRARGLTARVPTVIVTLGSEGAVLVTATEAVPCAGLVVDVLDTTGAGDCFVGTLAAGLAAGEEIEAVVARGVQASALACTRSGAATAMPTGEELGAFIAGT